MSAEKQKFAELLENATLLLAEKNNNPGNISAEQLLEAEIFVACLKDSYKVNPNEHPLTLAEKLHVEDKASLLSRHAGAKAQAEKFAIAHGMSDKEKKTHLADLQTRLNKELKKFEEQWVFNLSLFSAAPKTSSSHEKAPADEIEKTLIALRKLGYTAEAVDKLDILLCNPGLSGREADDKLDKIIVGDKYDIVVNGTFFYDKKPLGTIIIDGKLEHQATLPKVSKRGALAVLKDGNHAIGLTSNNDKDGVTVNFNNPGKSYNRVISLMAGGALIINNGKGLLGGDILKEQKFDQLRADLAKQGKKITSAWQSEQLKETLHTVFALRRGQLYVIVTTKPVNQTNQKQGNEISGAQIQKNLVKLGFDSAVIFDGGSRCYLNSKDREIKDKSSGKKVSEIPCGFGIKIRKPQGKK
ncbi:MAG TPA: phosphodiester glycosidase family protein [Candidatus Rifleibacterium sp.]|nr:phosphodiester glycosidase family protein [Candidatus Rifleibacterium sp.]HPW58886.1 phosphodiester glycosidase family protein [Candidatus Rifleibacterium sp.]